VQWIVRILTTLAKSLWCNFFCVSITLTFRNGMRSEVIVVGIGCILNSYLMYANILQGS
jgi:hypothetical protein